MTKKTLKIYLSGGWFDPFQEKALTYLEEFLGSKAEFEVFSPRKEIIISNVADLKQQKYVFDMNVKNIDECDVVISSTVSKDMGTLFENGYAYAKGKPVIYTFFDERFSDAKFNVMLSMSGMACFTDKKEFESFMNQLTPKNYLVLRDNWQGQVE